MNFFLKVYEALCKVENILKGSLDSTSSPSPSAKIQIMGRKVFFRCKGKTLMVIVKKNQNKFVDITQQCFALLLEFSMKVKVMRSNLGYLLKSFLHYTIWRNISWKCKRQGQSEKAHSELISTHWLLCYDFFVYFNATTLDGFKVSIKSQLNI